MKTLFALSLLLNGGMFVVAICLGSLYGDYKRRLTIALIVLRKSESNTTAAAARAILNGLDGEEMPN